MIYVECAEKDDLKLNKKEIIRYLGYKDIMPDDDVLELIDSVLEETLENMQPRACFNVTDINTDGKKIDFGAFEAESYDLSKNLKNCQKAVVFCATIGADIDRIIFRYSKISPSKAVVAQATGAMLIEAFCNFLCEKLETEFKNKGFFLRPRFSPGYGDFDISYQRKIFDFLNCSKHIGVSLTESLIMTPSKSVSGVIGISVNDEKCEKQGCEVCSKRSTCEYSRG